jgi:hypothetical protein
MCLIFITYSNSHSIHMTFNVKIHIFFFNSANALQFTTALLIHLPSNNDNGRRKREEIVHEMISLCCQKEFSFYFPINHDN